MAASDNLNPRLFHGTSHWFKPGDIVEPRTRDEYYQPGAYVYNEKGEGDGNTKHTVDDGIGAYASTDVSDAERFAQQALERELTKAVQNSETYQYPMFTPVFSVEHVSEHRDPFGRLAHSRPNYRRDKAGFRVVGNPVAYAYRNPEEDKKIIKYNTPYVYKKQST